LSGNILSVFFTLSPLDFHPYGNSSNDQDISDIIQHQQAIIYKAFSDFELFTSMGEQLFVGIAKSFCIEKIVGIPLNFLSDLLNLNFTL
jgi:hypothetical protein